MRTRELDFIVIGAHKAGTTSLWRYLEDNPALRMPPAKEAPFFSEPSYPSELRSYMRALFKRVPRGARLGTVTPVYMLGARGVDVREVATRISRTFPRAKLVALLRDPVERAVSAHRLAVQEFGERRPFAAAIRDLLEPGELRRGREAPDLTNTYVTGGEYGRVLASYLERFDREQILVELTSDLEREPREVVRRVCDFVGVPPHEPESIDTRFFVGGQRRVSPDAEADLKRYLDREAWGRVRHGAQHREAFDNWFRLWNSEAAPAAEPIDAAVAASLRDHYAEDTRLLEAVTGIEVPWREDVVAR
jgi:hypothetical protein